MKKIIILLLIALGLTLIILSIYTYNSFENVIHEQPLTLLVFILSYPQIFTMGTIGSILLLAGIIMYFVNRSKNAKSAE